MVELGWTWLSPFAWLTEQHDSFHIDQSLVNFNARVAEAPFTLPRGENILFVDLEYYSTPPYSNLFYHLIITIVTRHTRSAYLPTRLMTWRVMSDQRDGARPVF